jgi:MFS superfamily sulfate permease-like transporter
MNLKLSFSSLDKDIPAGIVVFLVALPLCLGVALASGAPLFAGIIAGIVGGIIVGFFSDSRLGVSGPAAGLTVIVAGAIASAGNYEAFLLSVVLAGAIQIVLGLIGAGKIAFYFPSSVIKGMLSAIGIIIILKQIPHAMGLDKDEEGDFSFLQHDGENTFSEILKIGEFLNEGAFIIGLFSLLFLIAWDKFVPKGSALSKIPGALLVVVMGILINQFFPENLKIGSEHLVKLPVASSSAEFLSFFQMPNFGAIGQFVIWKSALVIAIIASLETLLCVEATDKLDPDRKITSTNQELFAQGIGNIVSGLIGGIPVTQVIVRSSANIQAGGKSKMATIFHGLLLLSCAIFIPNVLNLIPLSVLAAVLIMVGYKLASPKIFTSVYAEGLNQFIPFLVTVVAIVFTDLLTGILIGLAIGIGYVLFNNFRNSMTTETIGAVKVIKFNKDIFFFNRAELMNKLSALNEKENIIIDATNARFVDYDIYSSILEFKKESASKNIEVELKGLDLSKTK